MTNPPVGANQVLFVDGGLASTPQDNLPFIPYKGTIVTGQAKRPCFPLIELTAPIWPRLFDHQFVISSDLRLLLIAQPASLADFAGTRPDKSSTSVAVTPVSPA